MHYDDNFDVETRKPEIVMSYNATKGGVDSMDQMCHAVTTKRKTNRWPMLLFYNVLDVASITALVVWRKVDPSDKLSDEDRRALFNITVAEELVRPQLERRQIIKDLCRYLKFTINTALHQHPTRAQVGEVSTPDNRKRGRCHLWPRHRDLKTTMRRSMCKSSVCSTHSKKQTVSIISINIIIINTYSSINLLSSAVLISSTRHLYKHQYHPFVINSILYIYIYIYIYIYFYLFIYLFIYLFMYCSHS